MVIDIGCGKRKQEPNSIRLDRSSDSAADALCNLHQLPWPVRDNAATKIYLSHVIEHLEAVKDSPHPSVRQNTEKVVRGDSLLN